VGRQGRCVLVIDEINRANLAQVFGELMYLLEYREETVALAGDGSPFAIPANVRLLGTMNTADRSLALVDHALRRRFAFLPLYPDVELLRRYHGRVQSGFPVEALAALLGRINHAIGDRNVALGMAYFLRPDLAEQLESIWQLEIEPALEELFFDQPEQVEPFRWAVVRGGLGL
jgi:5-methylcytosine-specific restriction protein B